MAGTTVNVRLMETGGSNLETTKTVNLLVNDVETLRGALSAGGVVAVTELMADHATFKAAADAVETLVEELAADHATFKTAVDQTETLVEELHDDHATTKVTVDQLETLAEELGADHATFKAAVDKHKRFLINLPLSLATVAIGTTASKVRTTTTATFLSDGIFKSKASTDDFWTLSGTTVSDGNFQKYLLCIDASGAASIVEGTQGASAGAVVLPAWPASKTVLGILQVQTVGAAFIPGTTLLSAAEVTDTYFDGFDPALIDDAPATLAASTAITSGPATLTAAKPASGPATLAASAAIPSAPATLTASVPSSTAVDAVGDMTAYKVANESGTVIA